MKGGEIAAIVIPVLLGLIALIYAINAIRRRWMNSGINPLIAHYGLDSAFILPEIREYLGRNIGTINDIIPGCIVIRYNHPDMLYPSCISMIDELGIDSGNIRYIIKNGDYNYIAIDGMVLLYKYNPIDPEKCDISVMKYQRIPEINDSRYVIGIYLDQIWTGKITNLPKNLSALSHENR